MPTSAEASYVVESCLEDLRIDGRSRNEYRPYTVTNGQSSSTAAQAQAPSFILSNGSSRVHLPGSTTEVVCSVKADLVHPSPSKPNEGMIELNVDLSLCGGGGSVIGVSSSVGAAGQSQRRQQREEESQIASLLQRLVLPHALNYEKLAVWPGKYVWRLAVDLVILRCDGCVLDTSSIALREALRNTKLPKVQAVMDGKESNEGSSKNDLVVDGDFSKARSPAGADECPLVVTVSVLSEPFSITEAEPRRRRSVTIIDARTEEEACASSRICVSADPTGMICGVHTLGGSGTDECIGDGSSIPLAMLNDVIGAAGSASENLFNLTKKTFSTTGDGYGFLLKSHFLVQ